MKKVHELTLIRKLGLGDNFPRIFLCAQKYLLGIGLIEPSTVIDMVAIIFLAGHKRLQGKSSKLMLVQE